MLISFTVAGCSAKTLDLVSFVIIALGNPRWTNMQMLAYQKKYLDT